MSHVIAVDESQNAEKAFEFADKNLPKEDKFIIFHGRPHWASIPFPGNSRTKEEKEKFEGIMNKYEGKCKETNRSCEFVNMWIRSPSEISYWINATVKTSNAKSVIVGERGISGIERVMLGSVSHAILHQSHIPVIIAKSERKYDYSEDKMAPLF